MKFSFVDLTALNMIWAYSQDSRWRCASFMMYLFLIIVFRAMQDCSRKRLIRAYIHSLTSSSYLINLFSSSMSSLIYHFIAVSWRQIHRFVLTRLASLIWRIFLIHSMKRWTSRKYVFLPECFRESSVCMNLSLYIESKNFTSVEFQRLQWLFSSSSSARSVESVDSNDSNDSEDKSSWLLSSWIVQEMLSTIIQFNVSCWASVKDAVMTFCEFVIVTSSVNSILDLSMKVEEDVIEYCWLCQMR